MNKNKKIVLMILDGWGIGNNPSGDAIKQAHTPFIDSCYKKYPHSKLKASEEAVGLPKGQMGNSEVGHFTLGAGRIVYQELVRINKSIQDKEINKNKILIQSLNKSKKENKKFHLFGLVSDGGVHSHIDHLIGICKLAFENGNQNIFLHIITDGRDTDPKSGKLFIKKILDAQKKYGFHIADVVGRYYAMDRDNRWERVKVAYDLWVNGIGEKSSDLLKSLETSYSKNCTDEFLKPIIYVDKNSSQNSCIADGDSVLSFNFRTDRAREITQALTQRDIREFNLHKLNLDYITMTNYDDSFKDIKILFEKADLSMTLGEVLEKNNKKQIRIAETEKYPHVTYFFSGGREKKFKGEKRIVIPSPKVATYDLQPEMSAPEITLALKKELIKAEADFICINFANPDMVGHTGVFEAVMKAVETVDTCVEELVKVGTENGYSFIIIADHGNADNMINPDGSPNTAHSLNLVPCILIDSDYKKIVDGNLGDIAPSILKLMGIPQVANMTGKNLIG